MTDRVLHTVSRVILIAATLLLLGYFVVYVVYAVNLMHFPFDYDQGEGFELVDTLMFSRGEWPYQDTEVYPFYSSNYPPLFHVLLVPFAWVFGPAYWYGRLLGFLGTLICAAAISYAVYREGRHRWIALLAGLAFLASNTVYHIGPLFRQHMTMVMFETLAVVVLARAFDPAENTSQQRRRLLIGFALLLAAGYTKQLAAITAIAALVFVFIRNPRRAILWGAGFAIVGGAIFLWMNIATDGQWWQQAIRANVNTYYAEQTIGLFRLWFKLYGFLLVPAALYVVYELYFARLSIYSLWFVATAILGGAASGAWGAGDSYFATSIAALCVLSGLFASRTLNRNWHFPDNYLSRLFVRPFSRLAPALATIGIIVVPLIYLGYGRAVLHMPTDGPVFGPIADALGIEGNANNGTFYDSASRLVGGYADIGHLITQTDIDSGWQIVDLVRASERPVLSEEAALTLLAGKEVITNPTQLYNLNLNGLYDGSALVDMVNEQAFGLVIFRAQFYPPHVLEAISRAYTHDQSIPMNGFDYLILRPRESVEAAPTEPAPPQG